MKRAVVVFAMAIICSTVSYQSYGQKYFAGTVKFEVSFEGDTDPQKHIPHEFEVTIFENKEKILVYNGTMQVIKDGDALTTTYLWDLSGFGGERVGRVEEKEQTSKVKYAYEARGDTKNICGYECKGYNVTCTYMDEEYDEEVELKYFVYTTTEIGKDANINAIGSPGLSGYVLYSEFEKDGVKRITQVKEVKKGKVKAVDFMIPSNYKMYNKEEWEELMQKIFGGGGEE